MHYYCDSYDYFIIILSYATNIKYQSIYIFWGFVKMVLPEHGTITAIPIRPASNLWSAAFSMEPASYRTCATHTGNSNSTLYHHIFFSMSVCNVLGTLADLPRLFTTMTLYDLTEMPLHLWVQYRIQDPENILYNIPYFQVVI